MRCANGEPALSDHREPPPSVQRDSFGWHVRASLTRIKPPRSTMDRSTKVVTRDRQQPGSLRIGYTAKREREVESDAWRGGGWGRGRVERVPSNNNEAETKPRYNADVELD